MLLVDWNRSQADFDSHSKKCQKSAFQSSVGKGEVRRLRAVHGSQPGGEKGQFLGGTSSLDLCWGWGGAVRRKQGKA